MLREAGKLWWVKFNHRFAYHLNGYNHGNDGWDYAERLGFWWRVVMDQPASIVQREDRWLLPEWVALVSLNLTRKEEHIDIRQFRGLNQVLSEYCHCATGFSSSYLY